MSHTIRAISLLAALTSAVGCGQAAGEGEGRAPVMFADNCAPCHGDAGQGNVELAAPAIAGLPAWYVEAQLHKFRNGDRGNHAQDLPGLRMRPMARTLPEGDVTLLASHVAGLAPHAPTRTVQGDADKGKALYATCAACHGPDGKGNEALNAPPIGQLDDWYIVTQIHNFKNGIRGADPDDTTGAQMAPMANTLPDEAAVHDVIAYLGTLGN